MIATLLSYQCTICLFYKLHLTQPEISRQYCVAYTTDITNCTILHHATLHHTTMHCDVTGPGSGLGIAYTTDISKGQFTQVNWTAGVPGSFCDVTEHVQLWSAPACVGVRVGVVLLEACRCARLDP